MEYAGSAKRESGTSREWCSLSLKLPCAVGARVLTGRGGRRFAGPGLRARHQLEPAWSAASEGRPGAWPPAWAVWPGAGGEPCCKAQSFRFSKGR